MGGWQVRGSDFAHKVHAEAWPVFDKWIERARVYLDQHKAIADLDPNWYVEMLTVAKARSWPVDKTRELVAEGLHKYPYYRFACAAGDLPTARKLFARIGKEPVMGAWVRQNRHAKR